MDCEGSDQSQSLTGHRSELKKRGFAEVEETSDSPQKRKKMRDLESVFQSEGGEIKTPHPDMCSDSRDLDLNINVSSANRKATGDNPYGEENKENHPKARPFSLDLNTEDVSSSANDPFFPYKSCENLKQRDDLECGSSVGPPDERDSMRVWKGLKQNNYMSPFDSTLPASIPKPRGKKKVNNDLMKKKIEQAKKEQVDRFARVAAPSGLLNGLNPGIINHVRNSKQVHSIIEALVKSEKRGNRHIGSKKFIQGVNSSGVDTLEFSHAEDGLMGRRQISDYGLFSKTGFQNAEVLGRDGDSDVGTFMTSSQTEDDKLALKLSSSVAVASENNSCLSNDESANLGSVNSLSFKAANVASQWLELLNQDIKGRLAALRRSKRRVRAVISTELPLLLSREFPPNVGHFDQATVDAHSFRWRSIFERMETTLSEEEGQLESWLNQVKEMQLHCEKGLYKNCGPMGNESSSEGLDKLEKELAVKAAAASIYSTCNFLLAMEKC